MRIAGGGQHRERLVLLVREPAALGQVGQLLLLAINAVEQCLPIAKAFDFNARR